MLVKARTWEQCPQMLAGKARGKWQIDPILPIYRGNLSWKLPHLNLDLWREPRKASDWIVGWPPDSGAPAPLQISENLTLLNFPGLQHLTKQAPETKNKWFLTRTGFRTVEIAICLNHCVLLDVCSAVILVACLRGVTASKGIPSEGRICESTSVGDKNAFATRFNILNVSGAFLKFQIEKFERKRKGGFVKILEGTNVHFSFQTRPRARNQRASLVVCQYAHKANRKFKPKKRKEVKEKRPYTPPTHTHTHTHTHAHIGA